MQESKNSLFLFFELAYMALTPLNLLQPRMRGVSPLGSIDFLPPLDGYKIYNMQNLIPLAQLIVTGLLLVVNATRLIRDIRK